jgi:hypothetical protein
MGGRYQLVSSTFTSCNLRTRKVSRVVPCVNSDALSILSLCCYEAILLYALPLLLQAVACLQARSRWVSPHRLCRYCWV